MENKVTEETSSPKVTYKVTNPNRRTHIIQGHQLKCGESIMLDEINFTELSLVVEKIELILKVILQAKRKFMPMIKVIVILYIKGL